MRRLSVLLACGVMALTLIAIAAGASAAAPKQQPPQPGAKEFYGALYYSQTAKNGCCYFATGTSQAAAEKAAHDYCQQKTQAQDCKLSVWVKNGYIALVTAKQGFAADYGSTAQEATQKAMSACQQGNGTGCKPAGTGKTALDPQQPTTGGYGP